MFNFSGPIKFNGKVIDNATLKGIYVAGVFILFAITGAILSLIGASILPVVLCLGHSMTRKPQPGLPISEEAQEFLSDI